MSLNRRKGLPGENTLAYDENLKIPDKKVLKHWGQMVLATVFICLNASSGIFIFLYTVVFSRPVKEASRSISYNTV